MKKLVLAMLVAAIAVPAFAAVNINATDEGNGVLGLWYECTADEIIRGIALRIEADGNATIAGTSAAVVLAVDEIDGKSFGFNTYMDYAFTVESVTAGLYEIDAGHPLAKADERGELDSFPAGLFSVSMGALDQLGEQAGVGESGQLMTIQFDLTADAVISISLDTLRGGVVGDGFEAEDVTVQASQTLIDGGIVEEVVCSALAKTTAGANISQARVNASRVETFTAAASSNVAGEIEYSFDFGDGNWTAWGPASQTKTFVYGGAGVVAANNYSFNVKVKARNASTLVESAEYGPIVMVSESVKSTATFYPTWAQFGRPSCWAFQRNCRGDTNNAATGLGVNRAWVNGADLTILANGFNKIEAQLAAVPNGICADFNRLATGLGVNRAWVNGADLTILANYFNKTEANVPICDQTNYHYWTN